MAVTLFFSSCMAVMIYFFVLAGHTGAWSAWVYAAFLFFLYAQMVRTRDYAKYRRIFQVAFAVLFMVSFIGTLYDERGSMYLTSSAIRSSEVPFCHIPIPLLMVPWVFTKTIAFPGRIVGHFTAIVSMFLIWAFATLTIGRGWCSWVCFYGGWEDGASRLAKKPRVDMLPRGKTVRAFQSAFFFFIVLASLAFMSSVYCEWFCPFKLVTEYNPILDIPSLVAAVMFIGLFLALVVVMPILTRKRFQCSSFCPFGAFQSLVDGVSGYRIAIDAEKCVGCLKCARACPFCAIDAETISGKKGRPERTCAKCGECVSSCPAGAIRFEFASVAKKSAKGHACARPAAKTHFGAFVQSILNPQYAFTFMAYGFGVVISSRFGSDALARIVAASARGFR